MANSGYWYNQYVQYDNEVKKYEKNLKKLNKILDAYGEFDDEKQAVNKEIDDLIADLKRGVRHNTIYTDNANELENEKEKDAGADPDLSQSMSAVQAEIAEINKKKSTAETNRNNAYRQYETDKEEEKEELRRKIFGR